MKVNKSLNVLLNKGISAIYLHYANLRPVNMRLFQLKASLKCRLATPLRLQFLESSGQRARYFTWLLSDRTKNKTGVNNLARIAHVEYLILETWYVFSTIVAGERSFPRPMLIIEFGEILRRHNMIYLQSTMHVPPTHHNFFVLLPAPEVLTVWTYDFMKDIRL